MGATAGLKLKFWLGGMSKKEVLSGLGVNKVTVIRWVKQGKIKAVRIVKEFRIPENEVERLHRWGFRKFQQILEYKAKLNGVEVVYVNPHKMSSLCPICGRKLSPNGRRRLKCVCGLVADRDVIGSWNIRLRGLRLKTDVGSSVPPESPSMSGGRLSANFVTLIAFVAGESERLP